MRLDEHDLQGFSRAPSGCDDQVDALLGGCIARLSAGSQLAWEYGAGGSEARLSNGKNGGKGAALIVE